jgi:hypothetical protein
MWPALTIRLCCNEFSISDSATRLPGRECEQEERVLLKAATLKLLHVQFLGWQSFENYRRLLLLADVVLDAFHFCVGSTVYEIFSFILPIVIHPDPFAFSIFKFAGATLIVLSDSLCA